MVDPHRVRVLLRSISDGVERLRREAGADEARRADDLWLAGIKYLFVTTIEAATDAAQHIDAAQRWRHPRDNGDAMTVLGEHGVLTVDLARRMRLAIGLRNVLVHEYLQVDDSIVVARLDDLSDLDSFVESVTAWLTDR